MFVTWYAFVSFLKLCISLSYVFCLRLFMWKAIRSVAGWDIGASIELLLNSPFIKALGRC